MNKLFLVLVALFFSTGTFSQGIEFEHGTLAEALNKAKAENKVVFMDCYTSWCGPCKALAKNVFPQKEVGDFFNKHFISVKMDCEKGEGPTIAKKYKVSAYPTMLFLDANAQVIHQLVGGLPAADLIKGAQSAINPELSLRFLTNKFEEGNRKPEFLISYLEVLKGSEREKMKGVTQELFKKSSLEKFMSKEQFYIIDAAGFPFGSKEFTYLLDHIDTLKEIASPYEYDHAIRRVTNDYLTEKAKEIENLEDLIKEFEEYHELVGLGNKDEVKAKLEQTYFLANKQLQNWFDSRLAEVNVQKDKPFYVNMVAGLVQEIIKIPALYESKKIMKQNFKLAHELAKTESSTGNILLIRLYLHEGDKDKALEHYNTCMKIAKLNPSSVPMAYVENLKKDIDKL